MQSYTPRHHSIHHDRIAAILQPLRFQLSHEILAHLRIHNSTNTKRRNNPTNPRHSTHPPIPHHLARSPIHPAHSSPGPIIQIQPQQMQRRAHELNRCRRDKLRHRQRGHVFLRLGRHALREVWSDQGGEVEGSEDSETVADREEEECREGDGPGC
jgi:hypothetical protein